MAEPLPPEIIEIVTRATTGELTPDDRVALQTFMMQAGFAIDPDNAAYINSLIDEGAEDIPSVDPLAAPLDAMQGAGDMIGSTVLGGYFGGSDIPAASAAETTPPVIPSQRQGDGWNPMDRIRGAPGDRPTSPPTQAPDAASLTQERGFDWRQPSAATHGSLGAADMSSNASVTNPAQIERVRQGGGTDWGAEAANMGLVGMPEGSAFGNVDASGLGLFANSPELFARQLAESRGGGPGFAGTIAPYAESALRLAGEGTLGGSQGKGLGAGPSSNAEQLAAAEAYLQATTTQPGVSGDPAGIYRDMFRRSQRTDPQAMNSGEGMAGDMNNQIQVTNGALAASMTPDMTDAARERLTNMLNMAAQDWVMKTATGEENRSYPEYLRAIGARRWIRS
jgi:hypothetical protein